MTAKNARPRAVEADIVERLRSGVGPHWADDAEMARLLAEAAAEIERLRAAQTWRPIETAPREGAVVLVFWLGKITTAEWINGAWYEYPDGWVETAPLEVTHWQPLPEPPPE